MLIAAAPVAIPVTTANPPTEAVANEAAQKTPIPEPTSATDTSKTKNSTESNEVPKNNSEQNSTSGQKDKVDEDGEQSSKQSQQERNEQQEQTEERQDVEQLKRIDREVRAHETAHAAVGGQLAGAPQLSFTTGPDGKRYAVSGEVSIDTSKVANNPQATIDKMLQVQRAALAPASPSSQDLKVAAIANQVANQARVELNLQRNEEATITAERSTQGEIESNQSNESGVEEKPTREGAAVFFTNPVAARRASLSLNQKLVDSGAFEDIEREQLISQTA